MKLVLDAMGGDFAPVHEVQGALMFLADHPDHEIILVGNELLIQNELNQHPLANRITIVHTEHAVTMDDSPSSVLREKKDSSMAIGLRMHAAGEADAFVSAGNTGAQLAFSNTILKRMAGVNRPGIGGFLPTHDGFTFLMDIGANVDCKLINLEQYAIMADILVREVYGISRPRIGLLNIGEEATKGNQISQEAHQSFQELPIHFIGNAEGRDILTDNVDIVICDGFIGNIILKLFESFTPLIYENLKRVTKEHMMAQLGAMMMKPVFKRMRKIYDYQTYGGVPLLGVNGVSIICHGKSSALALSNALHQAVKMVESDINAKIIHGLKTDKKFETSPAE